MVACSLFLGIVFVVFFLLLLLIHWIILINISLALKCLTNCTVDDLYSTLIVSRCCCSALTYAKIDSVVRDLLGVCAVVCVLLIAVARSPCDRP